MKLAPIFVSLVVLSATSMVSAMYEKTVCDAYEQAVTDASGYKLAVQSELCSLDKTVIGVACDMIVPLSNLRSHTQDSGDMSAVERVKHYLGELANMKQLSPSRDDWRAFALKSSALRQGELMAYTTSTFPGAIKNALAAQLAGVQERVAVVKKELANAEAALQNAKQECDANYCSSQFCK